MQTINYVPELVSGTDLDQDYFPDSFQLHHKQQKSRYNFLYLGSTRETASSRLFSSAFSARLVSEFML